MSRRINRRKKEKVVAIIAIAIAIIATIILINVIRDIRVEHFINNAEIVKIVVGNGHGITHYSSQFRPEWIKVEEYNILITELNNLPQSGEIYSGQIIKFYK